MDNIIISAQNDVINAFPSETQKIHIRIKQRTARKCTTTIENLSDKLKLSAILQEMKRKFHCNGSVGKTDGINFIQLFGDQREGAKKFLIENEITTESNVIIHGY